MTVQTPQYLEDKLYSARVDRQLLADLITSGVKNVASVAVTSTGGVNSVSVAAGTCFVPGSQSANQGLYRVFNDAPVVLPLNSANTNPRVDQIIVRVLDHAEDVNAVSGGSIEVVSGVETAGATLANRAGAVALPHNSFRLADVLVAVGVNNVITASTIQDRRNIASPLVGPEIGSMVAYAGSVDPGTGIWVPADGSLIDRTLYATYYARAGHAHNGNVDPGNNKVRLPDKRGRALVGVINMGAVNSGVTGGAGAGAAANDNTRIQAARGVSTGGEVAHTSLTSEMPVHNHSVYNWTRDGAANGSPSDVTPTGSQWALQTGIEFLGSVHEYQVKNGEAKLSGGGGGHNNLMPYEADLVLVRIA